MGLERGDFDCLAVMAPPGSAKTTYVSHLFPSWYLNRNPDHLIISGSHTQQFASRKIGRVVRNLVGRNVRVLDIGLATDTSAMDDWGVTYRTEDGSIERGGGYRAVGVNVAIAGERADLGLVEDPFAKWDDGQSSTAQDAAFDWYKGDFVPRLKPKAKRVVIMTRFNEFDLIGRILERDAAIGIKWKIVKLPMEAGPNDPLGRQVGEILWPEWFTDRQVLEAKADPQKWSALYQQEPAPFSGDFFKDTYLRPYNSKDAPARETLTVYGGSDYAVTAGGGDYTVHIVIGIDPEGRPWLLDLWRNQQTSEVWVSAFCDLVLKWKPMEWAEEKGQITSSVGPWLDRETLRRKAFTARTAFPTRGSKAARAQSIRALIATTGLYVPVNEPWYAEFRSELMSFPYGLHDDQVDALGLIGRMLAGMIEGHEPEAPKTVITTGYAAIPGVDNPPEESFKLL